MDKINSKIRLTNYARFLANFLSKNALYWLEKRVSVHELEAMEIIQTCIFLASKINERDICIPTVPDIVIAGGKQ